MRFTESATLIVVDKSTKQLNQIDRKLRQLGVTARKLQSDLSKLTMPTLAAKGFGSITTTLRKQSAEARITAKSLGSLTNAYSSAAAGADRFAAAAMRANEQMRRLSATSRSVAQLGSALGAGHGWRAGGYSAHIYSNPGHALTNQALGGVAGHNLTLSQALTIAAVGAVTIEAAHVVLSGAVEGSKAREKLFQSGSETPPDFVKKTQNELARRYGASSAAVNQDFAEMQTFSHDAKVQAALVGLAEKNKTLARSRGDSEEAAGENFLRNLKGYDLMGLLRPGKNGEVDTDQLSKFSNAISQINALEGRNIKPQDFKNFATQAGIRVSTMTEKGVQRALLYGSDVTGARAGTQLAAYERLVSGTASGGVGKRSIAKAIEQGFAVRDKSGNVTHAGGADYEADPLGWIAKHSIEQMHKRGLDETKTSDVSKYTNSLKFNSSIAKLVSENILKYKQSEAEIGRAANTRTDDATAETTHLRQTGEALNRLENSVKSLGDTIDASPIGKLFRDSTNELTKFVQKLNAGEVSSGDLAKYGAEAAAAGVAAFWGGSKLLSIFNPLTAAGVSLNTAGSSLNGSAAALTAAAGRLGGAGALGAGAGTGTGAAAGAAGAAGGAGTVTVKATLAAAAVPVATALVASAAGAAVVGGVTRGLAKLGVIEPTRKEGTAAWLKSHPGASGRQDRQSDEWFRGKRRDVPGALKGAGIGGIGGNAFLLGASGGGASVGTPSGPTIPRGAFLSSPTFEETLKKFGKDTPSTIGGMKSAAEEFRKAGGGLKDDISSGADDLRSAGKDASSEWLTTFKNGAGLISSAIGSALSSGVSVNLQQIGPSTGSASPSKQ